MKRIDVYLSETLKISRSKAQELIKHEYVKVNEKIIDKSSFLLNDEKVEIIEHKDYVSRGAYKLIGAIESFKIDFNGKVVVDMGASTGGFTQVALENGAKKVYAVDVGKGELDKSLVCDERVFNMEERDIRSLLKEEVSDVQIVIGDLSFISLKKILPLVKELFGKKECVLLFKPQFECGKELARKYKGVIKEKGVHKKLLSELEEELKILDFEFSNLTFSPIKGKEGNIEYLIYLNGNSKKNFNIESIVNNAFANLK